MGPEAGLRQRIRNKLRDIPEVRVWGWPATAFAGAGHPDLFGVAWGKFFGLELKSSTGRPTIRQKVAIRDIRKAGGYAWIVRTPMHAMAVMALIENGERPPMPEEALEIDDWFKSLDESAPAQPATKIDDQQDARDQALLGLDLDEPAAPTPEPDEEFVIEEDWTKTGGDAQPSDPTSDDEALLVEAWTKTAAALQKLNDDLRTVGDRVTMCWESVNRTENMVLQLGIRQDKLLALVMEDDAPEIVPSPFEPVSVDPPKRRRRSGSVPRSSITDTTAAS